MRDCKLAKGGARMGNPISCLVSIDGACIARSRVATEVPCVFDENFHFEYVTGGREFLKDLISYR